MGKSKRHRPPMTLKAVLDKERDLPLTGARALVIKHAIFFEYCAHIEASAATNSPAASDMPQSFGDERSKATVTKGRLAAAFGVMNI